MDIKRFLKLFKKYLWILILVPIIAATVTYFLSKNLPKTYVSTVQIATGIVDESKQLPSTTPADYYKTSQQFYSIIEKLKMRKIMSILSYNLIIHDLQSPKETFRPYSKKLDSLPAEDRQALITAYKIKLAKREPITVFDNNGKYKLFDILASMGYDEATINKKLAIFRPDGSDFINLEYTSENPLLSAFLVNTLATNFIQIYSVDVYSNQNTNIVLLDSLLKVKERDMNSKNNALKNFKMKNGVLNLSEQAATVYGQISQAEDKKAEALRLIQANQGALSAINSKLKGGVSSGGANAQGNDDNSNIIRIRTQLQAANARYIDGNFKPADKRRMDSLQAVLTNVTQRNSENNVIDPLVSKQTLLNQKSTLEISTEETKNTLASIDRQLATLKSQYNTMVPFDANIQNFERDADIATKDYMAALDKTNQGRAGQTTGLKLQIAQLGLPAFPQASKAIIFVALSAVASFIVCFGVLVILYLMDHSINTTDQLFGATKIPVLGSLNLIAGTDKSTKSIWHNDENDSFAIEKDLLRSLRFEISKLMGAEDKRVLGITSLSVGEGKTFLASNLAYAYAMTGKKVLLIGGDEKQPTPVLSESKQLAISQNFETFLVSRQVQESDLITRLNKVEENKSLLEIQSEKNLKSGFEILRKQFDIIIIDINSLVNINLAKEWLSFTEKNIAVFEAGKSISDEDKKLITFLKSQSSFMGWVLNKVKLTEITN